MDPEKKIRFVLLLTSKHFKRCTSTGISNQKGKYFKCRACGKIGSGETITWPLKHIERHGTPWWEDIPEENLAFMRIYSEGWRIVAWRGFQRTHKKANR